VRAQTKEKETLTIGDAFYLPLGHNVTVAKDVKLLDFSPEKELKEVMDHLSKKMAELNK
jgi:hypothetical protein